jgi:hypothetical protein
MNRAVFNTGPFQNFGFGTAILKIRGFARRKGLRNRRSRGLSIAQARGSGLVQNRTWQRMVSLDRLNYNRRFPCVSSPEV